MSLLGAYKKKTSYDGYESLQLVDSGGDSFGVGRGSSSGSATLAGSIAATLGPKAGPLREEDCSTMDSSGKRPLTGSDAVPPGSQWLPDPIDMADYRLGRAIVPLCKNREVLPSPAHLHICGTMRSANTIQTGLKATLQMCKVSKKKSV